jgi:hypothetical protein
MRERIVAIARQCLGTPYEHQGRVRGSGMDCFGPLVYVADTLGLPYEWIEGYPRRAPTPTALSDLLRKHAVEKGRDLSQLLPGNIGVFWTNLSRYEQHVGIFSLKDDTPHLIHCWTKTEKVVEHVLTPGWIKKLTNVFEFPVLLR